MIWSWRQSIVEIMLISTLCLIGLTYLITYNAGRESVEPVIQEVPVVKEVIREVPSPVMVSVDGTQTDCILINGRRTTGC